MKRGEYRANYRLINDIKTREGGEIPMMGHDRHTMRYEKKSIINNKKEGLGICGNDDGMGGRGFHRR